VGLPIKVENWRLDLLAFCEFNQLLEDLALELETREMSAVCQNQKDLLDNRGKELNVELSADINISGDVIIHVPHALQSNLHQFRLLVLDSKDDRFKNAFKTARVQI